MLMKVKMKMLIDKVSNLLPKKKPVKQNFQHLLYAQRTTEPQKSRMEVAIAFLLPFVRECGMVMWGDLKWIMSRRRQSSEDVWADAVERMQERSR
jgi:hypothetical protein